MVAFYALLAREGVLCLEHLWVLPEHMRHGIGRRLFQDAAALGARRLTIEADPNAAPFYRHVGAVQIGTATNEIEERRRELPILAYEL